MTSRHFNQAYPRIILFLVASILPLAAYGTTQEVISEKRIAVAMRMIGHEVLVCAGDSVSRILPIEKIDEQQYKIPFDVEFGFDPEDIAGIVGEVMVKTSVATDYLVEMVRCENRAIVHSFEIRSDINTELIACSGRILPKDCYSLVVTILNAATPPSVELASQDKSLSPSQTNESNLFKSALLIVPFLFLVGFIGYYKKKKSPDDIDPNLIVIGSSQFNKRNMALSFEGSRVNLSNKEGELLALLHTSANEPVEREVILQKIWGDEGDYIGRTLDVFISKLRKKLEADTSVKIVNIRGVGYKLLTNVPK